MKYSNLTRPLTPLSTFLHWSQEVATCWPFNKKAYPNINGPHIEYLRHVALHVAKDAGRIIASIEPYDHGKVIDSATLYRSTRNMLVNALRICELQGWNPGDLLTDYARERYAESSPTKRR